jgi:hypothetical protein
MVGESMDLLRQVCFEPQAHLAIKPILTPHQSHIEHHV